MRTLESILDLFRGLHQADYRLQVRLRGLIQRFFQFLKSTPRGSYHGTRHLRLRADRDAAGRIRRISWTVRIKATKIIAGKKTWLTRRKPGHLQHDWIYRIAKDWARRADYDQFESERVSMNALRSQIVKSLRSLRLAFDYGWTRLCAAEEDLARAAEIVGKPDAGLASFDIRAVAGAIAYCRELRRLETEIGLHIEEYRRTFRDSVEVTFEPAIRTNPNGSIRLYWGFPQRIETAQGSRTFTDYIPGRPTDRWMRQLRIRPATRKEVGAFLKRLLPLEHEYAELLWFLARHRKRARQVLARVERFEGARAAGGGLAVHPSLPSPTASRAVPSNDNA